MLLVSNCTKVSYTLFKTFLFSLKVGVGALLVLSKLSFLSSVLCSSEFCPVAAEDFLDSNGVFGL